MENKKRLDLLIIEHCGCSRSYAGEIIEKGWVKANGKIVDKPGKMLPAEVTIEIDEHGETRYVSRGGHKLKKALDCFQIQVTGKVCLDVGASTGGFTHCLLEAGAKKVYAVDSGSGQLSPLLQKDPRVISMERTNIRQLEIASLQAVAIAAADVSFISLTKVLEPVKGLLQPSGELICLIKPQFEAGRQALNKKGVVKDSRIHEKIILDLVAFVKTIGLTPLGLTFSPIRGPEGNIEYLLYAKNESVQTGINFETLTRDVVNQAKVM